jgi:hypothetical protein
MAIIRFVKSILEKRNLAAFSICFETKLVCWTDSDQKYESDIRLGLTQRWSPLDAEGS